MYGHTVKTGEKGHYAFFKSDEFKIRVLTKDDAEEYNALLRYAFQVTEADLAETGWKDDEIKQSKFPVLERADVLGCFNIIDKKRSLWLSLRYIRSI